MKHTLLLYKGSPFCLQSVGCEPVNPGVTPQFVLFEFVFRYLSVSEPAVPLFENPTLPLLPVAQIKGRRRYTVDMQPPCNFKPESTGQHS